MRNTRISLNNTSGFKGVHYEKSKNRWIAEITFNGKKRKIGRFKTPEEASFAYQAEAKKLNGEFYNAGH